MVARKDIDVELARKLKAQGLNYKEIGDQLGTNGITMRMRLDPQYADRRREQVNETRRIKRYGHDNRVRKSPRVAPDDLDSLPALPSDTRSVTGRLCGDPLPGRSALDQRKTNQC
ncbi:hypothetical protein FHS21_001303 [Phyllobacterium trifolii]|uniref:Uncharacterized protein n=1 Tax=Phyllobacterium trifolii TaxID=300193 RepID=A0A839U7E1_9HYPH|nr:hypothetical protein [Phyllobacterium trifolii]